MKNIIISISGKMGSGKDTLADVIIGLFTELNLQIEKTSFADPLKKLCSDFLGIPLGDFYDQELKIKQMDEQWWYLQTYSNNKKDIVPYTPENLKKYQSMGYVLVKPTPRLFMQKIGTDLFRKQLHPHSWVNTTVNKIKCNSKNYIISDTRFPNEISSLKNLSDTHEVINIHIQRYLKFSQWFFKYFQLDDMTSLDENQLKQMDEQNGKIDYFTFREIINNIAMSPVAYSKFVLIAENESETALDKLDVNQWDYHVKNDGTLDDLKKRAIEIFKQAIIS